MLEGLGKHASATVQRRFVWTSIVWPLVLQTRSAAFTLGQYQHARDSACRSAGVSIHSAARGLASLQQRGIVRKEGRLYSIHYRLIPYMRLGAECSYATAVGEVRVRAKGG